MQKFVENIFLYQKRYEHHFLTFETLNETK
jgi:hypothetical protein